MKTSGRETLIAGSKCPSNRAHGAAWSKHILLIHVGCEARKFQPHGEIFLLTSLFIELWAVAVATAIVGDGAMPAAGALVEMTAECSGTAAGNGQQYFALLPAEPLTVSLEKSASRGANQIGHLQGWPAHLSV